MSTEQQPHEQASMPKVEIDWSRPAENLAEANERIQILYAAVLELTGMGRYNQYSTGARAAAILRGQDNREYDETS